MQNDRTIPNNKTDIVIRDNEKRTCVFIDVAISGDRNVIKKEAEKIRKYCNRNSAHVESESKSDTSNNRGNWSHLRIFQTVPEQHTREAHNRGTTKNGHIGQCTHTTGSSNVRVQNIFHMRRNIACSTNCKYRTAATLYTLETWLVLGE